MGAVTRPHGVRGEVCVDWYADDASLLDGPVLLDFARGESLVLEPESWRPHKGGLLVRFEGVESRDGAEALRGAGLWVPRERLPALPEGEAYIEDLLGREVRTLDGALVGRLHHIETPAGQMLWAIREGGHEILFPAQKAFLVSLGEPIVLDPPEGLLEACRSKI